MNEKWVNYVSGVPTEGDFSSTRGLGSPLCINVLTGQAYYLKGSVVTAVAGFTAPTGTGFAHVTAGALDAAAKLVDTADVNNDQITYAKMQNISATARFLGRITAGAGDPEELTGTQATTLLDAFTSALKGLVPPSGGGTTSFLRADATFAVPPGSWTFDSTTNTTSGTSVVITIPSSYNDLLFVCKGNSHNGAGTPFFRVELSPDGGTTYTPPLQISSTQTNVNLVQNATLFTGVQFDRFLMTSNEGSVTIDSDNTAEAGTVRSGIFHMDTQPNRARFTWSGGETFDAGTIDFYGR